MPARNTLEQLLAPYTNPESHNAQRHRQTDGQQAYANSRSYCVAVRSAKNQEVMPTFVWQHSSCRSSGCLSIYSTIKQQI